MPTSVGDLAVNVSTNTASLESGFARISDILTKQSQQWEKTARGAQDAFSKLDSIVSGFGVSLRALGGLGAVAGFGAVIKSTADFEVSLLRLSQKIGVSVEEFSSLGKAAKNSGTDFETVASLSAKFSKNLATAGEAGNQTTEVLARLGFKSTELAGLLANPAEGLRRIAQQLNTFKDDGNKAAAAMLLFGKSGADALPFLRQLGDQTVLTATVTTEAAKRAEQFQIALNGLIGQSNALSRSIGEALLPAITGVIEGFAAMNSAGGKSSGFWTYVGEGVRILALGFATLGTVLKNVIVDVVFFAEAAGKVFSGKFNEVPELFKKRNSDIEANTNALGKFFNKVSEGSPLLAKLGADFVKYQQSLAVRDLAENADHFDRIAIAAKGAGKGLGDFGKASTEAARAAADAAKAISDAEKELTKAQEALDALWQTEDQKVSPAMHKLIDLMGDPAWAKFTATERQRIEDFYLQADAIEHTTAAFTRLAKSSAEFAEGRAKDFAEWQASVEKNAQSIDALVTRIEDEAAGLNLTDAARRRYLASLQIERDLAAGLFKTYDDYVAALDRVSAAYDKLDAAEGIKRANEQLVEQVRALDSAARDAFVNIGTNGVNAFKDIGKSIEKYVLEALYKLALQPFIIQIGASLTGLSPAAVAQALGVTNAAGGLAGGVGGGNILSNVGSLTGLGNLGSAGGIFAPGAALGNFATSAAGQSLGLSQSVPLVDSIGGLDTAFTGTTTALTGFGAAVGTAIPVIGAFVAAGALIYSFLSDKKPSPTRGQFQITPPTTPASAFEDQRFTASSFGNLGFVDAATQYFSGEAAQAFNQIVATALDAFQTRYSPEQSQRLAGILQNTTFAASTGGTQSTEDFIKQYGGEILKQVVQAAFDVLDPALGSVATAFVGTADDFSKFANTLLSIHDATATFSDDFKANIVAALADATQATADKIAAFVAIVQQFGTSIQGLGPKLEALDPSSITAFIDALGGAQQAAAGFAFIGANFTTTADRVSQAQAQLTSAFDALGQVVPTTHQAFLDLLNSFDLTTDGGRQLYASVVALAPLFVQVAGTADQAAEALKQQIESAQEVFNQNFFSDAERQASAVADAFARISQAGTALGLTIPTTLAGFRALIEQVLKEQGANSALYQSLIVLAPAVLTLSGNATAAATAVDSLNESLASLNQAAKTEAQRALDDALSNINSLVGGISGTLGDKDSLKLTLIAAQITQFQALMEAAGSTSAVLAAGYQRDILALQHLNVATTQELARFTVLSAQYDASRAEQLVQLEQWYKQQKNAFAGMPDALAALGIIFQQKWDAIINGAGAAASSIDDFIKSIQQLASSIGGNQGQQLGIELALSNAKLAALQTQYATLISTSPVAVALLAQINQLKTFNTGLSTEIANYLTYSAQYGSAIADQLVTLELAYKDQQAALAGNNEALAILATVFQDKWDAIISGTAGAIAGIDAFIKSIQGLADATQGNVGQQAGIELALSSAKLNALQAQYASLDPTSTLAKAIAADIAKLQTYNAGLATQIGHFVVYTAQYNAATANQLVELENWYAEQQEALAGNNDALAILGDIFKDKWQAIIDGVKAGVDELDRLKVNIAEYLKGLVISDISPLTPRQKLDTARQALEAEIGLAQGGDVKALGDVTQYLDRFLALDRDFNKSNQQFSSDFLYYTQQLANIAGVQPSGQPLDSSAAIAAVLPVSGTLASSDDMKAVRDLLARLIADLADSNTADSIAERAALQDAADEIAAAVGGSQLK